MHEVGNAAVSPNGPGVDRAALRWHPKRSKGGWDIFTGMEAIAIEKAADDCCGVVSGQPLRQKWGLFQKRNIHVGKRARVVPGNVVGRSPRRHGGGRAKLGAMTDQQKAGLAGINIRHLGRLLRPRNNQLAEPKVKAQGRQNCMRQVQIHSGQALRYNGFYEIAVSHKKGIDGKCGWVCSNRLFDGHFKCGLAFEHTGINTVERGCGIQVCAVALKCLVNPAFLRLRPRAPITMGHEYDGHGGRVAPT